MRFSWTGALRPVAAVAALLCLSTALPALADTLTVSNIKAIEGKDFELSVPSVVIEDGNFTEDQVRALFGTGARDDFAALAGLTARSVAIPSITLTYQVPGSTGPQKSTTVYHDLELTDVVDGVAAGASLASTDVSSNGASLSWGKLSTGRFDMSALLGFYGIGPGAGTGDIRPILDDFHFAGGSLTSDQYKCHIGEATAANFSARPLRTSLIDLSRIVGEIEQASTDGKDPSPEDVTALVGFYVDILTAMRSSPMSLAGFDCTGESETDGKTTVTSGPITIGGFEPGIYPPVSTEGLDIEAKDGWLKLGNVTLKQIDFTGPLALVSAATKLDEDWFVANARKLIPAFDGFSLKNLSFDLPTGDDPEGRIAASLAGFDISLDNYANGVPTDISLTADGLDVPVPADATDGPAPELLKAGIERVTLDFGSHVRWDSAANEVDVDQLMINAGKLGRIAISGTLGNATDKLFDEDPEVATAAASALTVKSLTIEIADHGGGEILMAAGARDAGQSEPLFRTTLAGMAQGMVLAVLGNSDDAMHAVKALGDFIAGAPELKLTLTSVDPAGLSLATLAGAEEDPTVLAGKVTISAETTGAPPATAPATEAPAPGADSAPGQPQTAAPDAAPAETPGSPAVMEAPPASDAEPATAAPAGPGTTDTVEQEKLRLKAPPKAQ